MQREIVEGRLKPYIEQVPEHKATDALFLNFL